MRFVIAGTATGRNGKYSSGLFCFNKSGPMAVHLHTGPLMIIESGATQAFIVEHETQRLDQVQAKAAISAQPDQIAGIGGYLRLVEHDIEHGDLPEKRRRVVIGSPL